MGIETDLLGLNCDEAASRLDQYGPNLLPGSQPKTMLSIMLGVVSEPMFLMLLVAGGTYLALGDREEAMFLLFFVFVVIGITLAQEHKTQRALEALRDLSSPRALVIRDGQELRIPSGEVVPGDLLVLHEGDRISADALLLQGQLTVNESLLTGEAVPVSKIQNPAATILDTPGGDGTSSLFASTVITKGVGLALVQTTGISTAVGCIGQALAATDETRSGLQQASRTLVRNLTMIAFGLVFTLILVNWLWNEYAFLESVLSGIALAMAILPEEIPVILTVFLALGAWRIAKIKVLTRRVTAVEELGAITILAVDKTGTLTQNRMQVAELRVDDTPFVAAQETELPESFHSLVEFAILATPIDPFDPMEKAIHAFGNKYLDGTEHLHKECNPQFQYELSPEILAMTQVFSGIKPSFYLLATKGAPEAVVDLCHLCDTDKKTIQLRVEKMAKRGLRVLGVARGEKKEIESNPVWPESQHDFDFTFLGLLGFMDPIRPEVPAAIAECRSAGIRVLMLTGDHPATAQAIAEQVGLSERPDIIMGDEIATLDDAVLLQRLQHADVCARMKPEQKLRLVQVLQQAGEVVAMTGDGVNDAPALKAANVGIAMGERGTDVAREAAALVLLDDSFASITAAIIQGRRIYDNIVKATRFIFAVHLPIIVLTLVPALVHWPSILLPVHIVLLQLVIDPACSVVFESEPAAADIMRRPPRALSATPFGIKNVGFALMQGGGIAFILLAGHTLLEYMGWDETDIRISVFSALVLVLFLLILANRDLTYTMQKNLLRLNPWLIYMFGGVILILTAVLLIPLLRNIMGFGQITLPPLLAAAALFITSWLWLVVLHLASKWVRK
ncbi:cation-translocating P-type ATPase [Sulfurovum sp.]|uniref:cation-translocating P-type ATPase n=1 Tax=Sulfurovum sp. TaxID=1969726 RepID=UPI002867D1CC|nr:cation-translocating P-type ATPase [Sulfurovum sp.]